MDTQMDRRSFCKNAFVAAAALVAAPVALRAVEPQLALADDVTVTCDVYVAQGDHGYAQVKGNAYLTNPAKPKTIFTGPFPNSSIANNAILNDETMVVTVDLVNTMFTLTSIDEWSSDGAARVLLDESTCEGGRYTQLKVMISEIGADYTFAATEHAGILSLNKSWPIHICVSE